MVSPSRRIPGPADVDEDAALLGRGARNGSLLVDGVRACRAGVDPRGDPVLETDRGSLRVPRVVRVDVEQAGYDEPAPRVDHPRPVGRETRFNRRDAAPGDSHVTDRVEVL